MVGYSKISLALMCVMAVSIMAPRSQAQNTPQDYLDAHNAARKAVGVGSMMWDDTVAAYAKSYADERKGDCKLQHSGGSYGENLSWGSGKEYTAGDAVENWVNEKQWYNYSYNSCASGKDCGHYTQVVWKNSTKLGCARVKCNSGAIFIICNYSPKGNVSGQSPY